MKQANKFNLRKKLLIDPEFQKSFLTYTIGTAMAVVGVFFLAIRVFFWRLETKGVAIGLPSDHIFFQFVREQRWTMDVIFLVTACATVAILVSTGLHLSNRIAGPIYRARKYLAAYREGNKAGKLAFREKDYFTELATSINEALESEAGAPRETERKTGSARQ
jgi:hypothetical protein